MVVLAVHSILTSKKKERKREYERQKIECLFKREGLVTYEEGGQKPLLDELTYCLDIIVTSRTRVDALR
jgi:hypothetical protein